MLYKEHSGRILGNGDTWLDAQGSGNSDLESSPVSIYFPKTARLARDQIHIFFTPKKN